MLLKKSIDIVLKTGLLLIKRFAAKTEDAQ